MGVATSFAGILMSAKYDLPTGPAMVCAFGILALLSFIARIYLGKKNKYSFERNKGEKA
jgi:ABC-type Mn2+/Zn2+ transport system permease subunit